MTVNINTEHLKSLEDIIVEWEVRLKLSPKQALLIETREETSLYQLCKQEIALTGEEPGSVAKKIISNLKTKYIK